MTEKTKNDEKRKRPYSKIAAYGCVFLLLMSCVLISLGIRLISDMLSNFDGFMIMGPGWAECADPGEYRQFTFSGRLVDHLGQPVTSATVEISSEELRLMLSLKANNSPHAVFCEGHYLHPISKITDQNGFFQFELHQVAYWDDLDITVQADGCLPYHSTFYKGASHEPSENFDLNIALECISVSTQ